MPHMTDIGRDDEDLVRVEFHEGGRRHESVHNHGAPADLAQGLVHIVDMGDAVNANAGRLKTLKIGGMGCVSKDVQISAHHIAPHGMILLGVGVVFLPYNKLPQVGRDRSDDVILSGTGCQWSIHLIIGRALIVKCMHLYALYGSYTGNHDAKVMFKLLFFVASLIIISRSRGPFKSENRSNPSGRRVVWLT